VGSLFVLRHREPDLPRPFRVPWYPLPAVIYLAITLWTLSYVVKNSPVQALYGLLIFALGGFGYWLIKRLGASD
jgi:APA family basic amino acid/polyamine antiporter